MPDGTVVPMWGYTCGALATGVTSTATCLALNPNAPVAVPATATTAAVPGWSPVVITIPTGQALTINLTNSLSFTAGTGTNTVPTSIMIVGQVGGGLGVLAQRTTTLSPDHSNLVSSTVPWPVAGSTKAFTPPPQGARVQSFSTEVAPGATTALTWAALRPGTYLIESGTHPSIQVPMGLYGILVVTCSPTATAACTTTAPAGTAYPGVLATATTPAVPAVTYNAELPLAFGEIDPVQNKSVQTAVSTSGFSETYHVIDADKAKTLNDKQLEPALIDPEKGVKLVVPSLEKIGLFRQMSTPVEGKSYWMAFSNSGRLVKRGDRVNVVIGQFHADNLVVE